MRNLNSILNYILIVILTISSLVVAQINGADTVWVSKYASGLLPGEIQINEMVMDATGNVYVTGQVNNFETSNDFVTIKYNNVGVEQWRETYNGSANSDDRAEAIAVDASGNVYVLGQITIGEGEARESVCATFKYNMNGIEQWVVLYSGLGGEYSAKGNDIEVDAAGNVYVCGSTEAVTYDNDFVTIKYNTNGEEQWLARYDGPDTEGSDTAERLVLDAAGNVYVTGRSNGSNGRDDYATIKYNNDGVQQWLARYNGPDSQTDRPVAIAVDDSGNVYVTGNSTDAQAKWNYATVKYNAAGVEQWSARRTGTANTVDNAKALVVNNTGEVYVTGNSYASGSSDDFTTIKYGSSGTVLWEARYNGASNGVDKATVIQLDADGNIFVAGQSQGTGCAVVKYTPAGTEVWSGNYPAIYNIVSLSTDAGGNVLLTGNSARSCATIKFTNSGTLEWDAIEIGPGLSYEDPKAMALDGDGNIYVAGRTQLPTGYLAYLLIKYDSSGVEQWVATYNTSNNSGEQLTDVAVDDEGNIYITGFSTSPTAYPNWATVKYNSDGIEQWAAYFDGAGHLTDKPNTLTVDTAGNVYVTGYAVQSSNPADQDMAVVKYNTAGGEEWVAYYGGPDNLVDEAIGVAVDGFGNVFITGTSASTSGKRDLATVKYNSSGTEQWVSRYDGPANSYETAVGIVVDNSGNIIVTGGSFGTGTSYDFLTIQYNTDGTEQWVNRNDGPGNGSDMPVALAVDDDGSVYVTGYGEGLYGNDDFITIKFDASGSELWMSKYNGPGNGFDQATSLAVGPEGIVYVTGTSEGWFGSSDYVTMKYDTEGFKKWETRYDLRRDQPVDIVTDGRGNVYVTGLTWFDYYESQQCATIKYSEQIISGINSVDESLPEVFWLGSNYPNPFNPSTTITYQIPVAGIVDLSVYNLLGQKVMTLVSEQQGADNYTVNFNAANLPSGVYFYRIQAGSFVETKKMILLK